MVLHHLLPIGRERLDENNCDSLYDFIVYGDVLFRWLQAS
jgi:hypothetical protein